MTDGVLVNSPPIRRLRTCTSSRATGSRCGRASWPRWRWTARRRRAGSCGFPIGRFPDAAIEQKNAAAYLELHIEQGPVLESWNLPLGVVLGTKGVERHAIVFHGQEAHSGSTPMKARRDALAAAAKLALEIRTIAGKHPDAVCTMGSVKTFPGIVTAVVGRCEATLDQRDLDARRSGRDVPRSSQEASQRFARRKMHGGVVAYLEH